MQDAGYIETGMKRNTLTVSSLFRSKSAADYGESCDDEFNNICNPSLQENSSSWSHAEYCGVKKRNEGRILFDGCSYLYKHV